MPRKENKPTLKIGGRAVGGEAPAFIIAELSANHGQKLETALKSVRAAAKAGADAIKIQTYTADTLTIESKKKYFRINQGTLWDGRTLYDLYKEAYTPWEWHYKLKKAAADEGLVFFSTPFDKSAADFLEELGVPCYKVASFELNDLPLVEYIAAKGKPVIMSTGISTLPEISEAVAACRKAKNGSVALLKCTSSYPAPYSEMNLRTMPDLGARFGCVAGLSDHSEGITAPVAAAALGAKIIEKHFILDRKVGGPDAAFSLEAGDFAAMVKAVRQAEESLGTVTYDLSPATKRSRKFSRSLFAVTDIKKGAAFTEANVRSIRPADGLPPKYLPKVLRGRAAVDIERGTPLKWAHLKK
ncbi:MAG: pseudaminic acid synthase [Elusimicrobia bacterium GWD2_63_28]|nr:MAG: pseudaminic acid synthase [Elusimicrobia bacterium GWD2_63_28]